MTIKNLTINKLYGYNDLTMQELLSTFYKKINECVNSSNNTNEIANWLVNEGLSVEVTNKLIQWHQDGTLENLINNTALKNISDKVDNGLLQANNIFNEGLNEINESVDSSLNSLQQNMNKVKYIAHRGMSGYAPENTLAAFKLAGEYGYYGCECDVVETLDGEFVILHDDTVDRTTNGTGYIMELTYNQIKNLVIDVVCFDDSVIDRALI